MAQYQAADDEFQGWNRTAADFLVHELGEMILKFGLWGNGVVIPRKDWDELVTGNLRTALGDAEGYCLRIAFVRATKWARQFGGSDQMEFVFDRRKEKEAEGREIFQLFEHFLRIEPNAVKPTSLHSLMRPPRALQADD